MSLTNNTIQLGLSSVLDNHFSYTVVFQIETLEGNPIEVVDGGGGNPPRPITYTIPDGLESFKYRAVVEGHAISGLTSCGIDCPKFFSAWKEVTKLTIPKGELLNVCQDVESCINVGEELGENGKVLSIVSTGNGSTVTNTDDTISYMPNGGYIGEDIIVVEAEIDGQVTCFEVCVTVNAAPICKPVLLVVEPCTVGNTADLSNAVTADGEVVFNLGAYGAGLDNVVLTPEGGLTYDTTDVSGETIVNYTVTSNGCTSSCIIRVCIQEKAKDPCPPTEPTPGVDIKGEFGDVVEGELTNCADKTLTVTNTGDAPLTNVIVTDVFNEVYTPNEGVASAGAWAAPDWTVGDLAVGASETLVFNVCWSNKLLQDELPANDVSVVSTETPDPVTDTATPILPLPQDPVDITVDNVDGVPVADCTVPLTVDLTCYGGANPFTGTGAEIAAAISALDGYTATFAEPCTITLTEYTDCTDDVPEVVASTCPEITGLDYLYDMPSDGLQQIDILGNNLTGVTTSWVIYSDAISTVFPALPTTGGGTGVDLGISFGGTGNVATINGVQDYFQVTVSAPDCPDVDIWIFFPETTDFSTYDPQISLDGGTTWTSFTNYVFIP